MFYFTKIEKNYFENRLKIISYTKNGHQMSKNWKKCSKLLLESTNKFWEPMSSRTNCLGDQMSRDCLFLGTNCGGPNVRGLNVFGTKCSGPNVCKMLNDDTRLMWLDNLEITSFLYRSVLSYASLLNSQRDKISEFLLIFQSIRIQQCC